jgi:hypothetical protein
MGLDGLGDVEENGDRDSGDRKKKRDGHGVFANERAKVTGGFE